jgi:hypothetical protein
MQTLTSLGLHRLREAILFLGCSRYANSEDPMGRVLVNDEVARPKLHVEAPCHLDEALIPRRALRPDTFLASYSLRWTTTIGMSGYALMYEF